MFGTANPFAPLIFKPGITQPNQGVPPEWSSLGQAGSAIVIAASVLIQYAATTGPVLVPTTTTPLTWQSEYPDQTPTKTLPTANRQFFASGFRPIIPTFTWKPTYPDRIPSPPRGQEQSYAGPVTTPTAAVEVPNWSGSGSFISAGGGSLQYAAVTGPIFVPPALVIWEPEYPDRLDSRTFPTANQQAFASGFRPIIPNVTSWLPAYPDRPAYKTYPTAEQLAFASGFRPIIPTVTSWLPVYPDRPFRPDLPIATSNEPWTAGFVPIIPRISSWEPIYPDRPSKAEFQTAEQGAYFGPIATPAAPVEVPLWSGLGSFIASSSGSLQYAAVTGPILVPAPPAFPDLSWAPVYPVQFFRPFPESLYVVWVGPVAPPVAPRGWAAFYPDRFPQPYVAPASGLYAPVMLVPPPTPSTDTTVIVIHRGRFRLAKSKGVVHRGEGRLIV